jgi:hypothetical protein
MKRLSCLIAALATPAWAHQHPINIDIYCTSSVTLPGLALLIFLLLTGIGIVRAVARHRKDR